MRMQPDVKIRDLHRNVKLALVVPGIQVVNRNDCEVPICMLSKTVSVQSLSDSNIRDFPILALGSPKPSPRSWSRIGFGIVHVDYVA